MPRTAFVSYNEIYDATEKGHVVAPGWHSQDDRAALALQTSTPMDLAEAIFEFALLTASVESATIMSEALNARSHAVVDEVWPQLQAALDTLDHVVLYIGDSTAEKVINLARQIPAPKLTFVMCDCNLHWKQQMISNVGLHEANMVVIRQCGGESAMGTFFRAFLETGELPPSQSLSD